MSTQNVVSFLTDTTFDSLPAAVVAQAKTAIQAQLGAVLAARGNEAVAASRKMAIAMGGPRDATILDGGAKVPVNLAAMVNTIMAGCLDLDDGAYRAIGHLAHAGRLVVPTSLALAECQGASGKDLVLATVLAYEVTLRAGWLITLSGGGYATSGMAGTYGAAAAAAKLFGLSPGTASDALGIAEAHGLHPSRAKRNTREVMTKEAEGWGAMTGVTAALLARAGFRGPETIFDLPEHNQEPLQTLGREWEILNLYFKPYSCCRYSHAPIDGVLDLMHTHHLTADTIQSVTVGMASQAASLNYYRPATTWEAEFSLPFAVGAAIADGEVGPNQIATARLGDVNILRQADKVAQVADAEANALRPGMVPARVTITTTLGKTFETWVPYPRGAPENPLSKAELDGLFLKLTAEALGKTRSESVLERLETLGTLENVSDLITQLNP